MFDNDIDYVVSTVAVNDRNGARAVFQQSNLSCLQWEEPRLKIALDAGFQKVEGVAPCDRDLGKACIFPGCCVE